MTAAHPPEGEGGTDILTLAMDPASQAFFDRMRREHYPPERNQIGAHLTLFHTLPRRPDIAAFLEETARRQPPFPLEVTGLRSLGRGVVYTLRSPQLAALHASLSANFAAELSPQDRQKFSPHVVVQNKASTEQARALLSRLHYGFAPFAVAATGLELWHYLGGPWQLARRFDFPSGTSSEPE